MKFGRNGAPKTLLMLPLNIPQGAVLFPTAPTLERLQKLAASSKLLLIINPQVRARLAGLEGGLHCCRGLPCIVGG